jgi:SAM-dependent methyltransferase
MFAMVDFNKFIYFCCMDKPLETNSKEQELKDFVDEYYTKSIDGIYYAHQPIYGYRTPYAESAHIARYMITRSILDNLAKYKFSELIDISAAEGYTAHLIKTLFGVKVRVTDWSESVCKMAKNIYGLQADVADIKNLPFKDNEFEVVLCSETLEHIPDWEKGFEELLRITNKLLVITVPHDPIEFVEYNRHHVEGGHINHFTTETFNFLKERNVPYYIERSNCPLLTKARVMAEAYKKEGTSLGYKIYNVFTPIFKALFGINTAHRLIDFDQYLVNKTGQYGDITLVIEKRPIERNPKYKRIQAKDFTGITISPYKIKD